jgi:endoribonuclease Dicer
LNIAGYLTGKTSTNNSQSRDVLSQFHSGHIQFLVATNVAEEGLDIQPCNLVICLDDRNFSSIKSYLQRKGRARHANSKFFVFSKNEALLPSFKHAVQQTQDYLDQPSNSPSVPSQNPQDNLDIYKISSTSAKITLQSAIPILLHFFAHLQYPAPEFHVIFIPCIFIFKFTQRNTN